MLEQLIEKRDEISSLLVLIENLQTDMDKDIANIEDDLAFSNLKLEDDLHICCQNSSSSLQHLKERLEFLKVNIQDEIDGLPLEDECQM